MRSFVYTLAVVLALACVASAADNCMKQCHGNVDCTGGDCTVCVSDGKLPYSFSICEDPRYTNCSSTTKCPSSCHICYTFADGVSRCTNAPSDCGRNCTVDHDCSNGGCTSCYNGRCIDPKESCGKECRVDDHCVGECSYCAFDQGYVGFCRS